MYPNFLFTSLKSMASLVARGALLAGFGYLLLACNFPVKRSGEDAQLPTEGATAAESTLPAATQLPTQVRAECPMSTDVIIEFNHAFQVNTGLGPWKWEAAGQATLWFDDAGGVSASGDSIAGQLSGQFSDGKSSCSFSAPSEVFYTASGNCQGGVVTLEIIEDWQTGEYQWTCDEDSFSFSIPQTGPARHPGLIFDLRGRLEGVTVRVPWGGGSGEKSWTIHPPPVPLTP